MESLGGYLQGLRLARGVSLEEMARSTRVAARYLEALEGDRWALLPAPAFTRGFIRAYCQRLGEPSDDALACYRTALNEMHPPAAVLSSTPAAGRWVRGPVLVSSVLLVVLGLALFLVSLGGRRQLAPEAKAPTPAASVPSVPSPPISVTPPPPETPVVASVAASARSRLVARTTEPTWVRIQTDAGIIEELLPAGATREWVSDRRFVLTIGNAGGISLELNGRRLPPLGDRGAVIHQLVLPRDAEAAAP